MSFSCWLDNSTLWWRRFFFNNSHPKGLGPLYQKNKGVAEPQNCGSFKQKISAGFSCNPKSHGRKKKQLPTNYRKKIPQNTWQLKLRERFVHIPPKGKIVEKYRKTIIFKHTLGGGYVGSEEDTLVEVHPTNWCTEAQVRCKAVAPCISVASTLACASNKWRATCDFVWTQCCWTLWDWKGHVSYFSPKGCPPNSCFQPTKSWSQRWFFSGTSGGFCLKLS